MENTPPPEETSAETPEAPEAEAGAAGGLDDIPDAMREMIEQAPPQPGGGAPEPQAPQFDELNLSAVGGNPQALSMLMDLALPVAIELGRTRMSVEEILALGRGSVIQLDRLAGEPIDVFVGDRKFAEGEVVVVGEQFGVRITQIVASPTVAEAKRA